MKIPLCLTAMFVMKNYMLHSILDKLYYPMLPTFYKYRSIEKDMSELAVKSVLKEGEESVTDLKETYQTRRFKQKSHLRETNEATLERIDQEIKQEKEQFKEQ